jgi:WD40 domain-containing protein
MFQGLTTLFPGADATWLRAGAPPGANNTTGIAQCSGGSRHCFQGLTLPGYGLTHPAGAQSFVASLFSGADDTLLILKGHAGRVRPIKFSPDGRTLASASDDRTLKLWEAAPAAALAGP